MSINRGDIFYIHREETVGSEQHSGRPAIIVSNAECNENSSVVEIVFLTCKQKRPLPTHVKIESAGRRSTALCEQITSVDICRLGDYKGHVTDEEMRQIDTALMCSLGLHPLAQQTVLSPAYSEIDDAALALIAMRFLEGFLQKQCGLNVDSEQN